MIPLYPLLFILISFSTYAINLEVIDMDGAPLFEQEIKVKLPSTVGDITINLFEKNKINYEGNRFAISEIFNIGNSTDIVSPTEMKAYGWCFSIDGQITETMPHETDVFNQNTLIRWFYGYAHFKNGEWVGQCLESSP